VIVCIGVRSTYATFAAVSTQTVRAKLVRDFALANALGLR
jgi:hypothetical protein